MSNALFLDRDGVINKDFGYVYEPSKFVVIDGIIDICKQALQRNYLIFIVTNQSGIGRGYYTEDDFWKFMEVVQSYFQQQDINFTNIYFSPYYPNSSDAIYRKGEDLRKPNTGMIVRAQKEFNIDLKNSILIGDKPSDIQAGLNAGVGRSILFTGVFGRLF